MPTTESRGSERRALVTGASSGIGAAFAERLAHDGFDLVVVARRRERLEAIARRLHTSYGTEVDILATDLSRAGQLRLVEERIAADNALSLLVNNAGAGSFSLVSELDPDRAEEMIRLHVVALTRLCRAALPGMLARGEGAIINVSSTNAFQARPRIATYCATKAYIKTFTEALHQEVQGTGIRVQVLCPDATHTEFFQQAGVDTSGFPESSWLPPDAVVDASLKGLRLGEVICLPTLDDPGLLLQLQERQRQLLDDAPADMLARRYVR